MPRPLRPIAENLVYHVVNRGNNREPVFHDDDDYSAFLKTIGDLKERRPFDLFGYCLMPDHVHLLIRPLGTPISRIMQSLLVSHTHRYHRRHRGNGHVWQGRFKSPIVQADDHLLAVLRHIEANPIRAGLVANAGAYPWSSFGTHGLGQPDELVDTFPLYENLGVLVPSRRRRWSAFVHLPPEDEELAAIRATIRSGLPYGAPGWVDRMGRKLGLNLVIRPRGRPRKDAASSSMAH